MQAGSIVAKTLYEYHASDYDHGRSFGLGVSLSKKTAKNGDASYGVGMPVVCSFNDQARDILPTIGGGEIMLTGAGINIANYGNSNNTTNTTSSSNNNNNNNNSAYNSSNNNNNANIPGLNRSLSSHTGHTIGEHASLKASIPISDIWQGLTSLAKPKANNEADGVSAGNQPMSIGDYVEALFNRITSPFVKDKEPDSVINYLREEDKAQGDINNAIIINAAHELGYNIVDLNDKAILDKITAKIEVDLNIMIFEKIASENIGLVKSYAENMCESLKASSTDIVEGIRSFESFYQETENNFKTGITSLEGTTFDGAGNIFRALEAKVGGAISVNSPMAKAYFQATIGTGIEYLAKGAVNIFGKDSVQTVVDKLKSGKAWVDEHATEGQQKIVEYLGGALIIKFTQKAAVALKTHKMPEFSAKYIDVSSKDNIIKVANKINITPTSFIGECINFESKELAKGFGSNEEIKKAAKHFFGKATNKIHASTNTQKYGNFKATIMENGEIAFEYSAKAENIGYNKRIIKIIDRDGNIKNHFKETINPEGKVISIKPF